jgi:hypothetical protein
MAVQPQDIRPSTGLVGVGVSDIVPEDLPIAERTTAPFSIAGQVHSALHVIVVKTIARAAIRPWFGVVAAEKEFCVMFYPLCVQTPGLLIMIEAKRRILNRF